MISFQQAIEIVRNDLSEDVAIAEEQTIEKPYGWLFLTNSKAFLKSGDIEDAMFGNGGTLVLKQSGKKIEFGSAFSTEKNLAVYELGYLDHDDWDIVITKIFDARRCLEQIEKLYLTYTLTEYESGRQWRIPTPYTWKQLKRGIEVLPLRLNVGAIYFNYKQFEAFKSNKDFEFDLEPNRGYINEPF